MGAVSVDIHRNEREFYGISLSDPKVVEGLITFRDKLDMYFESATNYHFDSAGDVKALNQELINTYAYLDVLIKNCKFSDKHLELIHLMSIGYTFKDIEEVYGELKAKNIKTKFERVCKKIANENDRLWTIWMTKNHLEGAEWKTCQKCEETLPLSEKFFYTEKRNADGFRSICKKC